MPRTTIRSEDVTDAQVKTADMAIDPTNASNLASGSVPLAQLGNVPATDTSGLEADIALLAFKTQANGNLARYNLVDQVVDAFEDASGINAPASSGDNRDSTGKYYSGGIAPPTGGTITTYSTYRVHSFLSGSTNFVNTVAGTADVMMIGGGGAGGSYHAGGAGAGGMIVGTGWTIPAGTHAAVVGAGGVGQAGNPTYATNKGANSTFRGETALGGGGGGQYNANNANPNAGGSTGGAGGGSCGGGPGNMGGSPGSQPNPSSNPGTGYAGNGGATNAGWSHAGGGGGGAGGPGGNASGTAVAGGGGLGVQNDFRTGVNTYYGGGGGAGLWSGSTPGTGGPGGGGNGGTGNGAPGDGVVNTGGGGGGFGGNNGTEPGGSGGSGIIVVRYPTTEFSSYTNMTLVSNTTTTATAPTKVDLVFTYSNGLGTAVLGTNVTAEASMDAGATWTDFAIAAGDVQGTTGGNTIVTKNNVTLTSTSGTNMRWRIKTLVQSASLSTRIHAVSLGWS